MFVKRIDFYEYICYYKSIKYSKRWFEIMNIYGYARVSTKEQNLARQLKDFEEMGIEKRFIPFGSNTP